MSNERLLPPFRELRYERLRLREEHLLDEIRIQPRPRRLLPRLVPRRTRSLVAASVLTAAVVAAPALAFSTTVRQLVGLESSSPPVLRARITNVVVRHRLTVDVVTVKFTISEPGTRPGTGVPKYSAFLVRVDPKRGESGQFVGAAGASGRYSATMFAPHGGIRGIEIAGILNRKRSPFAAGGLFIPIVIVNGHV